ncbi:hypothetical protein BX661DRAFT_142495 [Kickxella alabastrina]|uniref:uncharacterized protein n=1 Tax=Kickxella alabastrina TaxID=61397 RepID=UPI00221E99B8|nr:uncharacterized protein BX661DRAFT_142495 [Kickxella alabastrina]KAI7829090.1 hypothetical protein BX661DRAFT_142495 [Kickxella alabastrina]
MPCPKQHRIRVVNTIDKAQLPSELTYTDGYVRGPDVPYPSGVLFPCSCTGDKCGHTCECMEVMCYDEDGLLCLELKQSIHECNYLCKCSIECPNRVVQRGANIHMEIFRTSYKGWGARALRPLRRGEYVCRYTGELITYEDSTLRDVDNTSTYLFDLDHEITLEDSNRFAIDAQKFGNISHFFNHSCEPNLVIRAAYINHLDQRLHELAFFACRDVKLGEELTFDYSPSIALTVPSSKDDHESNETYKKFRCYCDTPRCRKVMFA